MRPIKTLNIQLFYINLLNGGFRCVNSEKMALNPISTGSREGMWSKAIRESLNNPITWIFHPEIWLFHVPFGVIRLIQGPWPSPVVYVWIDTVIFGVSCYWLKRWFMAHSGSRIKPIYSEFEIGEREIASSKLKNWRKLKRNIWNNLKREKLN